MPPAPSAVAPQPLRRRRLVATLALASAAGLATTVAGPVAGPAQAVGPAAAPAAGCEAGPSCPGQQVRTRSGGAYAVTPIRLASGDTLPARWDPCQARITWRADVSLAARTPGGRRSARQDVRTAIAQVSAVTGITFQEDDPGGPLPDGRRWWVRSGAEIVIAWVRPGGPGSTVLGADADGRASLSRGGFSFRSWPTREGTWRGATGRGVVVVNARRDAVLRPGAGPGLSRVNLLLHELGHVFGLAHVSAPGELMNPVLSPEAPAGLGPGDRAGLAALGRAGGCVPVPPRIWPDR